MLKLNNYYNMDCVEAMKQLPDKYFDLAIVDPPYGIGSASIENNKSRTKRAKSKDYKLYAGGYKTSPEQEYFEQLFRVSKNQIIWGANHFISKMPYDSACWVVWDKQNAGHYADCELAWTSFKTAVKMFTFTWAGMRQGNMKDKEFRIHPHQKPVALYIWLLNNYAKPGDKILDTNVGSASSLMACIKMGFDFMGFELDKHYYNLSKKRLEQEQRQISMFSQTVMQPSFLAKEQTYPEANTHTTLTPARHTNRNPRTTPNPTITGTRTEPRTPETPTARKRKSFFIPKSDVSALPTEPVYKNLATVTGNGRITVPQENTIST